MPKWFEDQWNQIRGHVKYDLIKWVVLAGIPGASAAIPFLLHWVQSGRHAPQQDLLGYVILGILIFCALTLTAILFFVAAKMTKAASPGDSSASATYEETSIPKPVDLRGEVLDLYFRDTPQAYGNYDVFMKLRVTNHGFQEATVAEWNLYVSVGEHESTGTQAQIPATLQLKTREPSGVFSEESFLHTALTPTFRAEDTYRNAIHRTGWIAFTVVTWGNEAWPVNAVFRVKMTDSLGDEHWIQRPSQPYFKTGELVVVEPPPLLPMARILMPPV